MSMTIGHFRALVAAALLVAPGVACAAELPVLHAPATPAPPQPKLAGLFELKLRLPEGHGLASLLLQAGVDRDDAAMAARLAAGHLGDGLGGCDAKVTVSRSLDGPGFRLERVVLLSPAGQTIIERHRVGLEIAPAQGARMLSRLV
jgi:hypothetical protein